MKDGRCRQCAYAQDCDERSRIECYEYYCSLDEDTHGMLDWYIEARRKEFIKEWECYTQRDSEPEETICQIMKRLGV